MMTHHRHRDWVIVVGVRVILVLGICGSKRLGFGGRDGGIGGLKMG